MTSIKRVESNNCCRPFGGSRLVVSVTCCCLILLSVMATIVVSNATIGIGPLNQVNYTVDRPFTMNMGEIKEILVSIRFQKEILAVTRGVETFSLVFKTVTLSPQFDIIHLNETTVKISRKQLEASKFVHETKLRLHATYIGHSILKPDFIFYNDSIFSSELRKVIVFDPDNIYNLPITIVQDDGIWGTIFIVSVSIFIIISYINIGAQLDMENIRNIIKKPKTVSLGFFITVILMPIASWFVGQWLLGDQLLYRVGSFIFACCPAASASTLWTVMLNSDKELSVSLQVASTIGALITMPTLLYSMDTALNLEDKKYNLKVPYARLTQTLFVLLVALYIGWRFIGRHERAQKISAKIFRPLTFSVLLYIIIFSSIIYWYIYKMFDWNLTLTSFIITMITYLISGLLGYIVNFNIDHAIAISISSTYKNSGIAFAVLLVAFESPDTYIAYVPCLTQVVTTSIMLYLIYSCKNLITCCCRRYKRTQNENENVEEGGKNQIRDVSRSSSKSSTSEKSGINNVEGEIDEFMAMITTDVLPPVPLPESQIESNIGEKTANEPIEESAATDKQ